MATNPIAIIVPSETEWNVVLEYYGQDRVPLRPYEHFSRQLGTQHGSIQATFVFSGCGKVPAAAATQYAIDVFQPSRVINIGTCGGLDPALRDGDLIVADKTVVYDLCERSGGQDEMIARFTTVLAAGDSVPAGIKRGTIVTGDQDADPAEIDQLRHKYGAIAADWESGAVAYITVTRNQIPCLVFRVVSDMVVSEDIYRDAETFEERTANHLPKLLDKLPLLL